MRHECSGYRRSTKKKLTLTLAFSILLLTACENKQVIKFSFVRNPSKTFSLAPESADLLQNLFVLDHLIATLFKNSGTGSPEPSAVDHYVTSEDKKNWKFKLKNSLFDPYGNPIKPSDYCKGILEIIPRLPNIKDMILFSKLKGWSAFIEKKRSLPLHCDDKNNVIEMSFESNPDGILDYLSMPVLGFWKKQNKSDEFSETGSFKIKSISDNSVVIYNNNLEAQIGIITPDQIEKHQISPNEIIFPMRSYSNLEKGSTLIKTTPTKLIFMELNPNSDFFRSKDARRSFIQEIYRHRDLLKELTPELIVSKSFYFDVKESSLLLGKTEQIRQLTKTIDLLFSGSNSNNIVAGLVLESVKKVTNKTSISYSSGTPDFLQRINKRQYDLRVGSVDTGTFPNYWVTEMMFCTNQGISFIDHESKVCNMLRKHKGASSLELGNELNKIIKEQATLVPLFHSSHLLYVGIGIDGHITSNTPLIRLDRLKIK